MRIEDILDAIAKIDSYTAGIPHEVFEANDMMVDAVVRNVGIIGEATRYVPADIQARYQAVDWAKMWGMRNVVIHEDHQRHRNPFLDQPEWADAIW